MTNKLKIPKNQKLLDSFRNVMFSVETFLPEIISETHEVTLDEYQAWERAVTKNIQDLVAWKKQVDQHVLQSNQPVEKGVDGD
jgi:hypothetical protein